MKCVLPEPCRKCRVPVTMGPGVCRECGYHAMRKEHFRLLEQNGYKPYWDEENTQPQGKEANKEVE